MKRNLIYLVAVILITSCGQNDKTGSGKEENATQSSSSSTENIISFKVDGEMVNSEGWIVQRFVWDSTTEIPWMNITSSMHKDKRTINVNLHGTTPGRYDFAENASLMTNSHGSYFPDFSQPLNSFSFVSGGFDITEVDTVNGVISGTFMGTAKDGNGKTVIITEGRLEKVKLKAGINNLSAELEKIK